MFGAAGNEGVNLSPVYILAVIAGAGAIIAFLFKLYIAARDREQALLLAQKDTALSELEGLRKNYQEMASEAINTAKATVDYYRAKEGKPPLTIPAPVISESHSPSTQKQREVAFVQTLRAAMVEIKAATGQPPRIEPEPAVETGQLTAKAAPAPSPQATPNVTILDAVLLKEQIAMVPEQTAEKVVDKLKEDEIKPKRGKS